MLASNNLTSPRSSCGFFPIRDFHIWHSVNQACHSMWVIIRPLLRMLQVSPQQGESFCLRWFTLVPIANPLAIALSGPTNQALRFLLSQNNLPISGNHGQLCLRTVDPGSKHWSTDDEVTCQQTTPAQPGQSYEQNYYGWTCSPTNRLDPHFRCNYMYADHHSQIQDGDRAGGVPQLQRRSVPVTLMKNSRRSSQFHSPSYSNKHSKSQVCKLFYSVCFNAFVRKIIDIHLRFYLLFSVFTVMRAINKQKLKPFNEWSQGIDML